MILENLDPAQLKAITEARQLLADTATRTTLPQGKLSDEDLEDVSGGAHLTSHEFFVMDCTCGWVSPVYDKNDFKTTMMTFLIDHSKFVVDHGINCMGNYAEYGPYTF